MTIEDFFEDNYKQLRKIKKQFDKKNMEITQKALDTVAQDLNEVFQCNTTCIENCADYFSSNIETFASCAEDCDC